MADRLQKIVIYSVRTMPSSHDGQMERPFTAFAICLSLSNLQYLRPWQSVQDSYSLEGRYFTMVEPTHALEFALIANVMAVAVLLFGMDRWLRRRPQRFFKWVYRCLFLGLFSLGVLRFLRIPNVQQTLVDVLGANLNRVAFAGLAVVLATMSISARPAIFRRARAVLLVLSPLYLIQIGTATWIHLTQRPLTLTGGKPLASKLHHEPYKRRVIWIIFDELDQNIAFDHRPAGLSMPELDRFRSESFHATAALPPAQWTRLSMPSLLVGRMVKQADPAAADELALRLGNDSSSSPLTKQPNIFTAFRSMGLNSAVVGWYHPYCRMFADELVSCACYTVWLYNVPSLWNNYINHFSVHRAFIEQLKNTTHIFYSQAGQEAFKREAAVEIVSAQQAQLSVLADRSLDFVLLHFSVPHPPGVYDRGQQMLSPANDRGYIDNLALVDRIVGRVRRELEDVSSWNESIVLVSSDHPFRAVWLDGSASEVPAAEKRVLNPGKYVPFILKVPFQKGALEYRQCFNTVISPYLLIALYKGEVRSADEVAHWLDSKRQAADTQLSMLWPARPGKETMVTSGRWR